MTIQAVFFDMGGTIETFWYDRQFRLEATPGLQQLLRSAGIDLQLSDERLFELISSGLERYKRDCIQSLEELPASCVWSEYLLAGLGVDTSKLAAVAEELMIFVETRYYRRTMRPEIPAMLEAIKELGLKIGLISNVNSRGQVPAMLSAYGIKQYFNPIVLSSEYGRRKPDPSIFHYAARLANVPASACVYVGDRIARDILGARKTGFRLAIQIKHDFDHGETDDGATPDFVINQMTELIDILKGELKQSTPIPQRADGTHCPVRAVLFDAGDVLYYRGERGRFFSEFLGEMAIVSGENDAAERFALRQQAYRGEIDQEEYQKSVLRLYGITQPHQISSGLKALEKDENNVQFFEGVAESLIALKEKGYLLGIVTDTANPVHAKLSWFERGGFAHVWDSITSSKDVGVRKPEPKIYFAALEQLGVPVEQAIFVGHKTSELEGARALGMKTIAFNGDKDAQADFFVERFADILKVPLLSLERDPL